MRKWGKWFILISAITVLSVIALIVLNSFGITSVEGLRKTILSCGLWGWLVFLALQVAVTTLLCFVPVTSTTFIIVSIVLFGALRGFLISSTGVLLSSMAMFAIGHFGGEKVAKKMVGEQSLRKAQDLVSVKSKIFLPLMFLFPVFPDDALCMVAGMTTMRWWEFLMITLICRTVGVATICFLGSDFINWTSLGVIDWFVFISVCLIDMFFVYKLADKLEKKIRQKK